MLRERRKMLVTDITTSSIGQYVVSMFTVTAAFASAEFGMAVLSRNTAPTTSRHYGRTFDIRNLTDGELRTNSIAMRKA